MFPFFGSSPRGRGTLGPRGLLAGADRFIPARAGNAGLILRPIAVAAVHPRAGGEREHRRAVQPEVAGSSPRGRGTLVPPSDRPAGQRFIPARAGNANHRRCSTGATSVHPRAGGERAIIGSIRWRANGSSPRGRGTLDAGLGIGSALRFIPARAGNAPTPGIQPTAVSGSSPRGRGTRRPADRRPAPRRFIPARAGNAQSGAVPRGLCPVHPRAGGERGR